ncbi:hypothetical protein RDI58_001203 [Solanum bulbocastanum]|uniref:Uncharacterized protein n=1 Tax=Solanum bulbocastanum TaxID=147425 RepID=A0AAN8U4P8_SOLBU
MIDREIGMDSREGTSRSRLGQRDRFPSEAQGESPVPLVPTSPTHVEARGDAILLTSLVLLVPEKARDTEPPVPIVPPPETGEQGLREVVSHHRSRDYGFVVIVRQDQFIARANLRVVDRIVLYR